MKTTAKILKKVLPAVFWIGIWELAYYIIHKDLLLASPIQVLSKMGMVTEAAFREAVGMTVLRSMEAWGIALLTGTLLAVLCHFSRIAKVLTDPMMSMIRATPVASFIILALVWLGSSNAPVLAGFLMSLPIVFSGVTEGIRSADSELKEMADMFRFGMQIPMPQSFERIVYYGRGPWENYADRKSSSELGIYDQTVTSQFYPYVRPQENGTKSDIRWWKVLNDAGRGLMVTSVEPFSASALHYTIESLDEGVQKHNSHSAEIDPAPLTNLLVDKCQQGLACVNSWGAIPEEEYRIHYGDLSFTYLLTPVRTILK